MVKPLRIKSRRTLLTAQWDSMDSIPDGTGEKKINQMKYCDLTVDIHVLSFYETLYYYYRSPFFHAQKVSRATKRWTEMLHKFTRERQSRLPTYQREQ